MKTKKSWSDDELRRRISLEELEEALRLEAIDALLTTLQVDAQTLHRLWIQPLMAAGATMDVALTTIARSCFQPN
jgi:hypothetical protein